MKNMCLFAGVFVATHTHARMVSPPSFGELPMSFRVMRGRATATAPVFSARWPLSAASFVWGGGGLHPSHSGNGKFPHLRQFCFARCCCGCVGCCLMGD